MTATITRYDTYGRLAEEQTFGHDTYWDGTNGATTLCPVPDASATSYAGMTLQNAVLYQGTGGREIINGLFADSLSNEERCNRSYLTDLR